MRFCVAFAMLLRSLCSDVNIIYNYKIKKKVSYFTLDNTENNDTAMEVIGAELGFNGRAQ